jgi:hypothetical protein
MSIRQVQSMLELCSTENTHFPPTILYNEGWMLRLILNWFSTHHIADHPLSFPKNGKWYSEALLPSTFLPKFKGDPLAESYTHSDGVIGHFNIGNSGEGDLAVLSDATHLVVLEAKMYSKLSSGVKNASYYNQAARNVACMAEVLKRGGRKPSEFSSLGFYVVAPESQIKGEVFKNKVTKDSIKETVERRANEYDDSKEDWMENWFYPTWKQINLCTISWEELIYFISDNDKSAGNDLKEFYRLCLSYNGKGKMK